MIIGTLRNLCQDYIHRNVGTMLIYEKSPFNSYPLIPIKSVQYESTSHSWSKNRYFAWECWTSLRRDWSNWKVSKLKDPIQNMSYIVPKQNKDFLHDRVALVSGRTLLSEGSEFLSFLQLITAGRTSATCVKVQLRWISSRTQTWTKGYRRGHRLDMEIVKRI